ncbi:MAG TPA: 16S rRNA (adenine(1518)-N(6)/adenine(1519)-N(6))-dimethyltransferase RsmA [Candidatus Eubacterium pullicola]|uniref:Ribosomal RNA small subunit methyltransferase A n=1 Tax=Gallibacter intestinalis TaxID=2779356 RepID=A0ABR9QXG4_9FIRM|nr:16S rRNA (adenine(1518)-N(6)/adenine(1519)-N(6))-dimethyltransferase RsmA [Gallibacter intestinalis]MBE5035583.1 16S rRNA (adenine(1518)-N(6)/adenine(1519)-N(6))-dimethyltransferase RsmA [Gallibacter intestinalis]HIW40172.1 16S rRNA (adenine(1518)-N(6)/adenine(1519)-N(6))-dimethyltransferase RsmA [Candidatus Eubacterium pullicola]
MKLYSPATIKDIRERYGFRLTKSLGQNFLTDKNIIDNIIEASNIGENDLVIEIGPGIGVITKEAAAKAGSVIAVEIDKNLIPILQETLADETNVKIINRDILKTDLTAVIEEEKKNFPQMESVRIIGNLPYYITTPIIMKLLEDGVPADSITVMMQKEVADRIKAAPGNKERGALSVAVQYYCQVVKVTDVPKEVFVPAPKVDSTVLRLDIRKEKPVELKDDKLFFKAVKSGFAQRRKTLLNSLASGTGLGKDKIGQILEEAGIDPGRRAETLDIDEFAKIANGMFEMNL